MIGRLGLLMVLWLPAVAPAPPVDVTGTWRVAISTSDRSITGKASLKQTGETVTGWVGPDENDPIPVDGMIKGGRSSSCGPTLNLDGRWLSISAM